jgi:hypothetical protein
MFIINSDSIGAIIAYKDPQKQRAQRGDQEVPDLSNVTFSPLAQNGISIATSALLDMLYNTDVTISNRENAETPNDSHNFISYLCKNGNLYELDSSKESSVLTSRVLHHQDQQANWIRPLIEYLEATFTDDCIDFSCAAIMRT